MLLPVVLFQSLKRRHFLVSAAAAITIALKVQIALSSSIFQTIFIQGSETLGVQILDSFHPNPSRNSSDEQVPSTGIDPSAYVFAAQQYGVDLPFGVSSECAYQRFKVLSPGGEEVNVDPREPVSAVVDGLFIDVQCLPLEDYTVLAGDPGKPSPGPLVFNLQFENCQTPVKYEDYSAELFGGVSATLDYMPDEGRSEADNKMSRPCSSLPRQNRQFMYVFTDYSPLAQNISTLYLKGCEAVLCEPRAWLSKVEVVDGGIGRTVSALTDAGPNTTLDIDPAQLMDSFSSLPRLLFEQLIQDSQGEGEEEPLFSKESDAPASTYARSRQLVEIFQGTVRNYSAVLAHNVLRHETSSYGIGMKKKRISRLHASLGICSSMVAISGTCAMLALFATCHSRRTTRPHHRDPATLLGSIIYLCKDNQRQQSGRLPLEERSTEAQTTRQSAWIQDTYSPLALRSCSRALLVLFIIGLTIALSQTLLKSKENDGLWTILESEYWATIVQSIPGLFMLLVSVYSSSLDASIRSLSILAKLSMQPCRAGEIGISLADMLGIEVLYHSVRLRVPVTALIHILAILCGLLPIIGSLLLLPENIPRTSIVTIDRELSWFGTRGITTDNLEELTEGRGRLSHLNLLQRTMNFTSPENTYRDLMFPKFNLSDSSWVPGASAQVQTSAAKLWPFCQRLSTEHFQIINNTFQMLARAPSLEASLESAYLPIPSTQHFNCENGVQRDISLPVDVEPLLSSMEPMDLAYFGDSMLSPVNPGVRDAVCHDTEFNTTGAPWLVRIHIWGWYSHSRATYEHVSVWECNYTWVDITTDLNLLWSQNGFIIDHNNPPKQDNLSIKPWDPPFGIPNWKFDRPNSGYPKDAVPSAFGPDTLPDTFDFPAGFLAGGQYLGVARQFRHILRPYGPLALEDLGDPDQEHVVLDLLTSTFSFAAAQLANIEQRFDLEERSDAYPPTVPDHTNRKITGTITDHRRRRVVQNPIVTFTLIGMLSFVAVLHIWGLISEGWRWLWPLKSRGRYPWLLDLELKGVAPPGFSSRAMMASLFEGSNCGIVLPENAHLMAPEELYRRLDGKEFRLGWFCDAETKSEVYTVGVLNEGNLVYRGEKRT